MNHGSYYYYLSPVKKKTKKDLSDEAKVKAAELENETLSDDEKADDEAGDDETKTDNQ
jgi:hypothetical protein